MFEYEMLDGFPSGKKFVNNPVLGFSMLKPASSVPIQKFPLPSLWISLTSLPLIEFIPF